MRTHIMQVFYHGSKWSGLFSAEERSVVARFGWVTIEKAHGFEAGYHRDVDRAMRDEVAALKRLNPNLHGCSYFNSLLNWPMPVCFLRRQILSNPSRPSFYSNGLLSL